MGPHHLRQFPAARAQQIATLPQPVVNVVTDGEARIVRYTCSGSGGTFSSPTSISLTAGLDPATPPSVIPNYVGTEVVSVDLLLTATSGTQVLIETGSRNPVEYFP